MNTQVWFTKHVVGYKFIQGIVINQSINQVKKFLHYTYDICPLLIQPLRNIVRFVIYNESSVLNNPIFLCLIKTSHSCKG